MTIHHSDDWLTIHGGDCREVLRTLPDESVQCVVTSPPYWGLRDYGTAMWDGGDPECDHRGPPMRTNNKPSDSTATFHGGTSRSTEPWRDGRCGKCGATRQDRQLGLEQTPDEYVAAMVDVFREVRRVLRRDGTCWINLGDSYAQGGQERPGSSDAAAFRPHDQIRRRPGIAKPRAQGLKPKDLVGIPWRVAFALQADGWYLRSDVIWSKPNPMPESVTDRPTKAHEYLFLLSKSASYHYDADAIREPAEASTLERNAYRRTGYAKEAEAGEQVSYLNPNTTEFWSGTGRNRRSVWTIATRPYPGAHFATFPEALVEPCIQAGTSEAGACAECGSPRRRVVERGNSEHHHRAGCGHVDIGSSDFYDGGKYGGFANTARATNEWEPTCSHEAPSVPCVVLDPFAGTGTVGVVAQRLSRRAVLIDLNPEYLEQLMQRNRQTPLGLVG